MSTFVQPEAPPCVDPFAPELASLPTAVVPRSRVVDPLDPTGQRPHGVPRIEAYRRQMLAGARFPPIAVIAWGARYFVVDGHKRLAAYSAFGRQDIRVELWTWRRWSRDQVRQAKGHWATNLRVLRLSLTSPSLGWRRFTSNLDHWRRVASACAAILLERTRS